MPASRTRPSCSATTGSTPAPSKSCILPFPSPLTDFFLDLKGKKVLIYHNITPARFFAGYSDFLARVHRRRPRTIEETGRHVSTCPSAIPPTTPTNCASWALPTCGFFPCWSIWTITRREYSRAYLELLKNEQEKHPVRRPHLAEQKNRRSDQSGFFLQEIHFAGRAPDRGRQYPFPAQILSWPCRTWPRAST